MREGERRGERDLQRAALFLEPPQKTGPGVMLQDPALPTHPLTAWVLSHEGSWVERWGGRRNPCSLEASSHMEPQ